MSSDIISSKFIRKDISGLRSKEKRGWGCFAFFFYLFWQSSVNIAVSRKTLVHLQGASPNLSVEY